MKANSKGKFVVKYSFLKPLSQNFEILTTPGDAISPKIVGKGPNWYLCTNVDRKIKIKSKRNFQVAYSFMKLFSRNLETQAPCCDVIISKLVPRDSVCISCTTGGKNIKSRTYNNFGLKIFF